MRTVLVLMVCSLMITAAPGPSSGEAAQESVNTWSDPNGAFTLKWEEPWEVFREEEHFIFFANETSGLSFSESVPVEDINPSLCLEAYIDASAIPEVAKNEPLSAGKTSWRAWAAVANEAAGFVDYFECQMTPDGTSLILIAGSTKPELLFPGVVDMVEFAGSAVVRMSGERAPAVVSAGWRAGVVTWSKGTVFGDLGLERTGEEQSYVVMLADLTNWQATDTIFPAQQFDLSGGDGSVQVPVDIGLSNIVAQSLGEEPIVDDAVVVELGKTRRVALVFLIDSSIQNLMLGFAEETVALGEPPVTTRFVVQPSPAQLPLLQSGTITSVTDSRTLRIAIDETGKQERVRLIGLDDAAPDAAKVRLASYVGQTVLLESDTAVPDDRRLQRYVWVTDQSGMSVMLNAVLIEEGLSSFAPAGVPARFDGMLGSSQGNGVSADTAIAATQPTESADPADMEAEEQYLVELAKQRDFSRMLLAGYDVFTVAPSFDERFYTNMGLMFQGWAIAHTDATELKAPARYADLQARFVAALEPFDLLAHQMEPELDKWFSGEINQLTLSGFNYDVMVGSVAAARPQLENVLAEIDQLVPQS